MSRRRRRKNRKSRGIFIPAFVPRDPVISYGNAELGHVVLLGDSILDNGSYTHNYPDVSQRLHGILGDEWMVSLAAVDGAVTHSLGWQLQHIPQDATHLIVSIGGNDAMGNSKILRDPREMTIRDALDELALMKMFFEVAYEQALDPVRALGIPVTICTIYDCDFAEYERDATLTALTLFNDVIIRYANRYEIPVLDLRKVVGSPEDFEMTIEPSFIGGAKIAAAIAGHVEASVTA